MPGMADRTVCVAAPASAGAASAAPVPPPRRRRAERPLELDALRVVTLLGLLPLAASVVGLAMLSHRRLPPRTRPGGRPLVYAGAAVLLLALVGRLWHLSSREVCLWLERWPALAAACGLPAGRVIHPAHLSRRVRRLGAYPFWVLYLALVSRAAATGLVRGRDVALDSTLVAAWSRWDPDAARAVIERFFAAAKRYYGLDTRYALGWDAVLLRVTLTFCAILVVALAADAQGAYPLRLSPFQG